MRMPFFIEMNEKTILIIGGGEEGTKRAEKYSKTGARIIVLSSEFEKRLIELKASGSLRLVRGDVSNTTLLENLIKESDLIMVTLGTRKYNEKIMELARKHRRLLNLANDAGATDVVIPIDGCSKSFRVAVTTEGKSSMAAREALHRILNHLKKDKELENLANLMYWLKKKLRRKEPSAKKRIKIYREVFNSASFREAAKSGDREMAKKEMLRILKEHGLNL